MRRTAGRRWQVGWEDRVDCGDWVDSLRDCGPSTGGPFAPAEGQLPPRRPRRTTLLRSTGAGRCGRRVLWRWGTGPRYGLGLLAWLAPMTTYEQAGCQKLGTTVWEGDASEELRGKANGEGDRSSAPSLVEP